MTARHTPPLTEAEQACLPGAAAPSRRVLRLGTRASQLAATQAGWVGDRLRALGHDVELVPVRTEGDASRRPLTEIGGSGVFASALRQALMKEEIDLAVHSLKDIPTQPEPGLVLAAVPEREDPRDVAVVRAGTPIAELPDGALVGTGSPRRAAQVALLAPQARIRDIRGNVESRIGQVRAGEVDAIVLAAAGLRRLGRLDDASEIFEPEQMLPAPGQGALAVECRADDAQTRATCAVLEDPGTRLAVTAERAVLQRLEAGCTAPIGALAGPAAEQLGTSITLTAFVAQHGQSLRQTLTGDDPVRLGHELAESLLTHLTSERDS